MGMDHAHPPAPNTRAARRKVPTLPLAVRKRAAQESAATARARRTPMVHWTLASGDSVSMRLRTKAALSCNSGSQIRCDRSTETLPVTRYSLA